MPLFEQVIPELTVQEIAIACEKVVKNTSELSNGYNIVGLSQVVVAQKLGVKLSEDILSVLTHLRGHSVRKQRNIIPLNISGDATESSEDEEDPIFIDEGIDGGDDEEEEEEEEQDDAQDTTMAKKRKVGVKAMLSGEQG
ncbi:hypothetical protein K2173_021430 [Erythroxylum novogranatense]|uniref:Uncharacterized protein n=1 Tax=Erythroxylum novogranatense TaxID=1862640 RepID=A0AAV8TXD4_9ROSI|nr:hypothetical protein K2173_021430 [Erythroxylum novogranatense]